MEALLIIGALAAFLQRAGQARQKRALYFGAGLAILASFITAWVFDVFFNGAHNDTLEGVVMLGSALLMLYVSGWLMLRQDPRVWQADVQRAASRALDKGTMVSMGVVAFLAVYREGAETVLFLHALASTSGGWSASLVEGLMAATLLLLLCYFIVQLLAVRLPLRLFFVVTSAFLFVTALKMVGLAVQEFQEIGVVSITDLSLPDVIVALLPNVTLEAVGLQALFILGAIASYLLLRRKTVMNLATA